MRRTLSLLTLLILIGCGWYFRVPLKGFAKIAEARLFPCTAPIPYTFSGFDSRFGISRNDFNEAVRQAEHLWDTAAGKDLFVYDPSGAPGDLTINLVYDQRQEATDKLRELGLQIDDTEKSYADLNAKYSALKASYDSGKAALDDLIAQYNKRKDAYEAKVSYWNSRGGASGATYQTLETERKALVTMAAQIKTDETSLNALADNINSLIVVLNRIARDLNLSAERYNTAGAGQEFEEGVYESSALTRAITIYQFDTHEKLTRVLAHEMGHALGLEHNDDPQAIMYRLNQGQNAALTAADMSELKKLCGP